MQCPKCEIEMDEVRKLEVIIDHCSHCGGIWLDRGELDKIREAEAGYANEREYGDDSEHSSHHHTKDDEKRKEGRKKKRGGFLTDLMEGFGGE